MGCAGVQFAGNGKGNNMREITFIFWQLGKLILCGVLWIIKALIYCWMGAFLGILGLIGFTVAFAFTVGFFAVAVELLRLYY